MLITSLVPLLSRYSLGFDLVVGPDETVTLTVIPRKTESGTRKLEADEMRPISITATAGAIDEELAKGAEGALGQLIAARKSLGDQLAEQHVAAEAAKTAAAAKPKPAAKTPAPTPAPKPSPTPAAAAPAPDVPPADAKPGEPASLW